MCSSAAAALASDTSVLAVAAEKACSTKSQPASKAQSQATTPDGSPPISPAPTPDPEQQQGMTGNQDVKPIRPGGLGILATQSSHSRSYSKQKAPPAQRQQSKGGGVQMVLDEQGSWSTLADQSATLPIDAQAAKDSKDGGSMLGFFRGRKGRDRSPKPKEAGVLGKAGARQMIN